MFFGQMKDLPIYKNEVDDGTGLQGEMKNDGEKKFEFEVKVFVRNRGS